MKSIIEHIKDAVLESTALKLHYHTAGDLNVELDTAEMPCAFCFLLDTGNITDVNGVLRERLNLAIFFVDRGDYDNESYENEEIIQSCKEKALKFVNSLRMNDYIRLIAVNASSRAYEKFDSLLTGFAVNITVEEIYGVSSCDSVEG